MKDLHEIEMPMKTEERCKSQDHWFDVIVMGGCARCGISEQRDEEEHSENLAEDVARDEELLNK